jgi:hypothetical protein
LNVFRDARSLPGNSKKFDVLLLAGTLVAGNATTCDLLLDANLDMLPNGIIGDTTERALKVTIFLSCYFKTGLVLNSMLTCFRLRTTLPLAIGLTLATVSSATSAKSDPLTTTLLAVAVDCLANEAAACDDVLRRWWATATGMGRSRSQKTAVGSTLEPGEGEYADSKTLPGRACLTTCLAQSSLSRMSDSRGGAAADG